MEAEGSRQRVTSDSLMHMVSCQPSSGGDSGRNTQSAPQAKALTRARYLHGNSKDHMRLLPGTQNSAMALDRENDESLWEPLAPHDPRPRSMCTGVQGSPGGRGRVLSTRMMSTDTYPQCLPMTSRTKVLWWLEKTKERPLTTAGKSTGHTETSAGPAKSDRKAAP